MLHEFLPLGPAMAAGLVLGAWYFAGLWWTVVKGVSSRVPALWFLGSMLLRTSVTLAGFYFVGRESWARWLSCLLGFIVARILVQLTRAQETAHAP